MACNNKNKIERERCIWNMLLERYYRKYADEKLNGEYPSSEGTTHIMGQLEAKAADILRLEGQLLGMSIANGEQIEKARNELKGLEYTYEEREKNLNNYIDLNQANNPRKVDTLDKKSRAYLTTSFYTISILTMSFFIYKQLKE